jgi:DNA polymerase I-like protein with 3'-5' exonuclease and polymerase domains
VPNPYGPIRNFHTAVRGCVARCVLLAADYSQIELRMLAHLSGDSRLRDVLRQSGVGGDMFELMWNVFQDLPKGTPVGRDDRDKAKRSIYGYVSGPFENTANQPQRKRCSSRPPNLSECRAASLMNIWCCGACSILYGQGSQGLASKLGIAKKAAEEIVAKMHATFPGIKQFIKTSKESARRDLGAFTDTGRRRGLPNIVSSDDGLRQEAERQAVNTIIQGSAADLVKLAMVKVRCKLQPTSQLQNSSTN